MQGVPTGCPYRGTCPHCPGDDLGRGEWESSLGFKRVEEGILCLDWDVVLPLEESPLFRTPEGRHITDAVAAADKIDEARRKWSKSPKRREAQRRFEDTDKGKAVTESYQNSEKFKLSLQKYRFSGKGQEALQKRGNLVKDFRKAAKWLEDNPGKTYEDYLKKEEEEESSK